MQVIPINSDYSNIPQFIDSLFDPDVRCLDTLQSAISAGNMSVAFSDQGAEIISVWMAAWQIYNNLPYDPNAFAHCPESDREIIAFLSHFLFRNNICMQIPNLEYLDLDGDDGPPIYQLNGYQRYDFTQESDWQLDTVAEFLELLMLGAHFVFIQASQDLSPGVEVESYYKLFTNSADLAPYRRWDPGNSHYTARLNICGYYVPNITSNSAPNPCPFLVANLVGPTVPEITCNPQIYSTFMQLEGWESPYTRHNTDYQIYKQTLWNISTFGSCVYSEKRGTTIFLAPTTWQPQPNADTIMAPYAGAETRQPWLKPDLIRLPGSNSPHEIAGGPINGVS